MPFQSVLLVLCCCLALFAPPGYSGAEIPSRRIDIHVDGKHPIAGERSRFATSPNGDLFFTYTLAAGDFSGKPLGVIHPNGEIELTGIDSESTWNVDGWGTFGYPFDLAVDKAGELHAAVRHRGEPYGVDYWHRVDGKWRLETFGAGVTYGGNNVSLGILPDGRPVVVCLDWNRSQLAVWERGNNGVWSATRPPELGTVASGHFDLVTGQDGSLQVVLCPLKGGPVCATRDPEGQWTKETLVEVESSEMISAVRDEAGLRRSGSRGSHRRRRHSHRP